MVKYSLDMAEKNHMRLLIGHADAWHPQIKRVSCGSPRKDGAPCALRTGPRTCFITPQDFASFPMPTLSRDQAVADASAHGSGRSWERIGAHPCAYRDRGPDRLRVRAGICRALQTSPSPPATIPAFAEIRGRARAHPGGMDLPAWISPLPRIPGLVA